MDKRLRSISNMHGTVSQLLDTYNDVLTADADLVAAEALRQASLGKFRIAARRAGAVQTPVATDNKESEKARVIREVLRPLGRVQALAHRTDDTILLGKSDFSASDLDAVPDAEIVAKLESLMETMRGVIAQIPAVPSARLDALDDEIDALEPLLGAPRSQIVDRGAVLREAEAELKTATTVLVNQHDMIVRDFDLAPATPAEARQRELFDRWDAARSIVDAASRSAEEPAPEPVKAA
jgi:hypothetical protein